MGFKNFMKRVANCFLLDDFKFKDVVYYEDEDLLSPKELIKRNEQRQKEEDKKNKDLDYIKYFYEIVSDEYCELIKNNKLSNIFKNFIIENKDKSIYWSMNNFIIKYDKILDKNTSIKNFENDNHIWSEGCFENDTYIKEFYPLYAKNEDPIYLLKLNNQDKSKLEFEKILYCAECNSGHDCEYVNESNEYLYNTPKFAFYIIKNGLYNNLLNLNFSNDIDNIYKEDSIKLIKQIKSYYKEVFELKDALIGNNMIKNEETFYILMQKFLNDYKGNIVLDFIKKYKINEIYSNIENQDIDDEDSKLIEECIKLNIPREEIELFYLIFKGKYINGEEGLEIWDLPHSICSLSEISNKKNNYIYICYDNGLSFSNLTEVEVVDENYFYNKLLTSEVINNYYTKQKQSKYIERLANGYINENKINISDIDIMSGYDFEKFVAELFQKMGYKSYATQESNDQGIDVVAKRDDITIAIQAKCYSQPVGNHAIMEAVAGMKYYDADKAMVVTNSTFTRSAIELAKKNNVQLWDRKALIEKIDEIM